MQPLAFPMPSAAATNLQPAGALPLRGKNLAVLCDHPGCARLAALASAAAALGASVTQIAPSTARLHDEAQRAPTAALLGRLYEGIECHGLPDDLVADLRRFSLRPVWTASEAAPTLPDDGPALRAWLLSALA